MKTLNTLNKSESRTVNGGIAFRCKICGFTSSNYFKTYANALSCVTRKYGRKVYNIASYIFG